MIASPLRDECSEVETFGFEDNSYVTDENTEIVACETYMTDIDAYSGTTSGLVTERTQSWGGVRHLLSEFPAGTELKMKMAVKILNPIEGRGQRTIILWAPNIYPRFLKNIVGCPGPGIGDVRDDPWIHN